MKDRPFELFNGAEIALRAGEEKYSKPSSIPIDEEVQKTDIGLALGFRIYLKKMFSNLPNVFMEIRGTLGLTNFIESYRPDKKQVRRNLALLVGYEF